MRYVELFAGIGGFRVGLEAGCSDSHSSDRANDIPRDGSDQCDKATVRQPATFDCVFANEYDKYARAVYRYHFGDIDGRDIGDVPPGDIPDADLWTFGAPCQDFSVAGRRAGLEGDRGNLFLYTLDLIEAKRPRYFLAENVLGLLSIDGGKAFANIIGQIAQMGYDCQWVCLNSKNFGVPQNRERLFIVGHLRGEPRPEILSFDENRRGLAGDGNGENSRLAYAVDSNIGKGPRGVRRRTMILQRDSYNATYFETDLPNVSRDASEKNQFVVNSGIRRLTPLETERLQAFPDNWTAKGIDDNGNEVEISDTQRYKMTGNAVTTSVIAHFERAFERLIRE